MPQPAPYGLMCQLAADPERARVTTPAPAFSWIVPGIGAGDDQVAYRILVASSAERLASGRADVWDSGRVESAVSLHVAHGGAPLTPDRRYWWKVRTWTRHGGASDWSPPQTLRTADSLSGYTTPAYPLEPHKEEPQAVNVLPDGRACVDFGRAAAGTVEITLTAAPVRPAALTVYLGEKLSPDGHVDREPGGNVRCRRVEIKLTPAQQTYRAVIPPDPRNTGARTLRMPASIGEVVPFRYCELPAEQAGAIWAHTDSEPIGAALSQTDCEHAGQALPPVQSIRRLAVYHPFDDDAAAFASSAPLLDRIWEMCRYSVKATSYCGLYIDGDRERFPREADAHINQLCHYAVDREYTLARRTHEFMLTHTSQWTEWILQSVFMAWADYLHTGDATSLQQYYPLLQEKALCALAREDGLISTTTGKVEDRLRRAIHYYSGDHVKGPHLRDIVDWPAGERDGFEFTDINTVVNAFHYRALVLMERIARALDRQDDADEYRRRAAAVYDAFNRVCFDAEAGLYQDGEGSAHHSLHANLFPVALGAVPEERQAGIAAYLKSRGMACSVYGAQYLLEALYACGEDEYALGLLTSTDLRSWANMLRLGSTVALEAWDMQYKPNLDWNHAWGAAPANIVPRFILGVRPLEPGWGRLQIQPQPGTLRHAEGRIPTIRGPVHVAFRSSAEGGFQLDVRLPASVSARVGIPLRYWDGGPLQLDGAAAYPVPQRHHALIENVPSGEHRIASR